MRRLCLFALPASALLLPGCLSTVGDVITAPVNVASRGVDLATTSQSEADEKRGREIREREEELAKLERRYAKQMEKCQDGDRRACDDATSTYAEMQQIIPTVTKKPEDY